MIPYRTQPEREAARKTFQQLFGLSLADYRDTFMILASGLRLCVDIVKLDDFLHNKFGPYEENGLSMSEMIKINYGPEALKFLEDCL